MTEQSTQTPPTPTPPAPSVGSEPQRPAQQQQSDNHAPTLADLRDTQAALDNERKLRTKIEGELSKVRQSQMDDSEKAIAAARDEGRAEGTKAAGQRLAAAEFRARAAGKIGNASVLLDQIDLAKFVDDDGEPNTKKIDAVIEKLAEAMPATKPTAPNVPGGPRPDPPDKDWLRQAMAGSGG